MINAWYKKDVGIQKSLVYLAKADMSIINAPAKELSTDFNTPQSTAMNIINGVNNSSMSFEHLKKTNYTFSKLYRALRFTISETPFSQADICNVNTDVQVLVNVFGSKQTKARVQKLYTNMVKA